MSNNQIRVLLIRRGETWVGQCLEYNVSIQGKSFSDVRSGIVKAIVDTYEMYKEMGHDFEKEVGPAPEKYFELYENAEDIGVYINECVRKLIDGNEPPKGIHQKIAELAVA